MEDPNWPEKELREQALVKEFQKGWEAGMTQAAGIVESRISFTENLEPAQVSNQVDRRQIVEAILKARDETEFI
jgi:hypothetical protein